MAADQYYDFNSGDPNQTDTSNGNGDWWTQNAPPVYTIGNGPNKDKPAQPMPGYDAAHDPYQGSWQINDSTGGWSWLPKGYSTTHQGDATPPQTDAATGGGGSFGGPVAAFDGTPYPTFTPPPLPDYLQKGFALPSAADLQGTPGYMARYQAGMDSRQRSAAARGTILNGGTQKALDRYGQDYASNEYGNLVNQKLGERQQQSADYLNLAYGPAWQSNQAAVNQYGTLYGQYKDLISNNRNSYNDYWQHQIDLLNAGLGAAKSGSPGSTGGQG